MKSIGLAGLPKPQAIPLRPGLRTSLVVLLTLALGGCVAGGADETLALDPIATGAIAPMTNGTAPGSDEAEIAETIAEIDLQRTPSGPFAWANAVSGSTGVIASVNETDNAGETCREFTTTLHRFDGIALYEGRQCRLDGGPWNLIAFAPVAQP